MFIFQIINLMIKLSKIVNPEESQSRLFFSGNHISPCHNVFKMQLHVLIKSLLEPDHDLIWLTLSLIRQFCSRPLWTYFVKTISSFVTMFLKSLLLQRLPKVSIWKKGLSTGNGNMYFTFLWFFNFYSISLHVKKYVGKIQS